MGADVVVSLEGHGFHRFQVYDNDLDSPVVRLLKGCGRQGRVGHDLACGADGLLELRPTGLP
jgi:hypothetical protein